MGLSVRAVVEVVVMHGGLDEGDLCCEGEDGGLMLVENEEWRW